MIRLKSSKFINEFPSIFLEIKSHMSDHQSAYNSGMMQCWIDAAELQIWKVSI